MNTYIHAAVWPVPECTKVCVKDIVVVLFVGDNFVI